MAGFEAGFSRLDITPPLGVEISGYFIDRFASGVLDPLELNTLAVRCGGRSAVLVALDNLMINREQMDRYRRQVAEAAGLDESAVFLACTHTHTGPLVGHDSLDERRRGEEPYALYLGRKLCDAARLALADCSPAKLGYAVGRAPHISFIRRFRMKDGSIRTNPGVNNPDIAGPIGEADERVNVLRFVREQGPEIVVANFGVHPDTIGGDKLSADYPRFVRQTTERALDNVRCVFFNGAEGDVNHVNVHPTGGDANGLHPMFDDADRGYEHAIHMGRVIAGAVLQVYDKTAFTEPESVAYRCRTVMAPTNKPTAAELTAAERICALHGAGRDSEIGLEGMELTTAVAEALRMVQMKDAPDAVPLCLTGVRMGEIAFVGIPGEPFTSVGTAIKAGSPFAATLPCCLTNGAEGYYPSKDAYDEGGYEARSSNFRAGVAELLADESLALLRELKER